VEISGVVATDAGLLGLWTPSAFTGVVDYDTWEAELLDDEDLGRHVAAGAFVPVNIGSDGAYQVVARVGSASAPAELTEREDRYRLESSARYLFVSGGEALVSGIEEVDAEPDADTGLRVPVPVGRWSVTVALIDWVAEPGSRDGSGEPAADALADFALLINPEPAAGGPYRTDVETFDR
jgi:hypothetical protein